jgi:D-arabinose 1-dehydrogenase-like Zn-dependent alcohol dehydrogenase
MSDIHFMLGDWTTMPKMSSFGTRCAGHEGAGTIVKVGHQVTTLRVGQRAGLKPYTDVCHACKQCKAGKEVYCKEAVVTGLHCDGTSIQRLTPESRHP